MPRKTEPTPAPATRTGEPVTSHAPPAPVSNPAEVAAFLAKVRAMTPAARAAGRGRLIFAMDATMSREPTWDMAQAIQAEMFQAVKAVGHLDVQLVYYRGFDECRASAWVSDPDALARLMVKVRCEAGQTKIGRVLAHALSEARQERVHALVFVGDCMEEEIDVLAHQAGELALTGLPAFMFQEGRNKTAAAAFREVARLTRGAYCPFDEGSAGQLKALLAAVAVYAAGGLTALEDLSRTGTSAAPQLLLGQLKSPDP